ncbi:MAG: hypothetical protein GC193_10750 [Cryomorphaceae bacterium]|nr:hypothetical protein [Cryomorphaceae bacterium]
MALKDYPGTGCPICWTRKGLNDSGAALYLTVQEVSHMVSHWRTHVIETQFGDSSLRGKLLETLNSVFAFSEGFSNWRRSHEAAELGNFVAEDKTVNGVDAYKVLRSAEAQSFDAMNSSFTTFEEAFAAAKVARSNFLNGKEAGEKEKGHFELIEDALNQTREALGVTVEARRRYFEKVDPYAERRSVAAHKVAEKSKPVRTCGCHS